MTATRTKPNGIEDLGDLTTTAETPVLDVPVAPNQPHLMLDFTLMMEPNGAECMKIVGETLLSAAAAHRLGQELVELSTFVGERRSLLGSNQ